MDNKSQKAVIIICQRRFEDPPDEQLEDDDEELREFLIDLELERRIERGW